MLRSFDAAFGEKFHSIMGSCFKSVENPAIQSFEMILALDEKGRVNRSWLNIETNISQCDFRSATDLKYPKPPFSPYHARITVELK